MSQQKTFRPGLGLRVRRAFLSWLGGPFGLTDEQAWAALVGAGQGPATSVTAQSMMTISTVWRCARLISETISTLPLSMYVNGKSGRQPAPQHPLHFVLHDTPNTDSTASMFWEAVVAAMLLRGNAHCERLMHAGRLVGLRFLAPSRLRILSDSAGKKRYVYTDRNGRQRDIAAELIWSLPGFTLDGEEGVSVLAYGARVFGGALAADRAAESTWERGLMPTTFFKMERVLTEKQRTEFRDSLRKISGALHAGESPLLEGGMDVGSIGIKPDEAQMLESRAFSVEDICRWFGVPPWMVGHTEKSTSWGTGIESQMIAFLTFTLGPWLRRIEQAISKDLLTTADRQRGYYPKFAVEGLLRADSAARASFYSVMVSNGIFTRDEVRQYEDRAPMGGNAAVLTVQSAMVPLDQLGQSTDSQAARAALRQWLHEPDDLPT